MSVPLSPHLAGLAGGPGPAPPFLSVGTGFWAREKVFGLPRIAAKFLTTAGVMLMQCFPFPPDKDGSTRKSARSPICPQRGDAGGRGFLCSPPRIIVGNGIYVLCAARAQGRRPPLSRPKGDSRYRIAPLSILSLFF